jgi:hypothetical protein
MSNAINVLTSCGEVLHVPLAALSEYQLRALIDAPENTGFPELAMLRAELARRRNAHGH